MTGQDLNHISFTLAIACACGAPGTRIVVKCEDCTGIDRECGFEPRTIERIEEVDYAR